MHEPRACTFSACTEPAKVSCDGTQLEVARGEKFCKAGCQIKNADPVTTDRPGRETGGLGIFFQRAILRAATAIAPLASRCWRWPVTGLDDRRSVRSRRATGLRGPLPIFAGLLVWLLSASLIVAAQAQTTSDAARSGGAATMKVIQRLLHKNYVQGLAWNSDGSKLATLSDFGALVTIWNARTWEKEREIRQYSAAYSGPGIGWTYDGKVLTSAGAKTQPEGIYSMNLWDPATGALVKRIEGPPIAPGATKHNQANRIAVSKSGSLAAIILGPIRDIVPIFGTPDWSINRIIGLGGAPPLTVGFATAVAFAPDEHSVVIANGGNLEIVDLQDGHTRLIVPAYKRLENAVGPIVAALTFSPDGKYLASAPNFFRPEPEHGPVRLWDTTSGNLVLALPGTEAATRTISWSADGARLAVVSDLKLRVWNVKDLKEAVVLFELDKVEGLAAGFSPSGVLAVTDDLSVLVLK